MTSTFFTLQEIVAQARTNLDRNTWDYLAGAAESETSMRRNRAAFEARALVPRILNDVSQPQARRRFLGLDLRLPAILAPIGSVQAFESGGAISVATAVDAFGTAMTLSSACLPGYREVAEAPGDKFYQLYAVDDDDWLYRTAEHAQTLGYRGFCITVDTQVYSRRERDILKRFLPATRRRTSSSPDALDAAATYGGWQARLTWDKVDALKQRLSIPLMVKGVATAADARLAVEHGVDVVWVSNHGGRQLDSTLGTLDMLPEVVDAVAGRARVVLDGGVQRGTDVLKALALGADVVALGRLQGFAMAAGGASAVVRMLEILEHEVLTNLALMGLSSIDQLTPEHVRPAPAVYQPHVTSGFPLLDQGY